MDASKILGHHQLRSTAIRRNVIEFILKEGAAVSHQDIEKALPQADRVTLYRTLATFEEKGILHQVLDDESVKKYALCGTDCSGGHHHDDHAHFKCEKCEETVCLDEVRIPAVGLPTGYSRTSANLLIMGTCRACA